MGRPLTQEERLELYKTLLRSEIHNNGVTELSTIYSKIIDNIVSDLEGFHMYIATIVSPAKGLPQELHHLGPYTCEAYLDKEIQRIRMKYGFDNCYKKEALTYEI